jgi:hypothetical protein
MVNYRITILNSNMSLENYIQLLMPYHNHQEQMKGKTITNR